MKCQRLKQQKEDTEVVERVAANHHQVLNPNLGLDLGQNQGHMRLEMILQMIRMDHGIKEDPTHQKGNLDPTQGQGH